MTKHWTLKLMREGQEYQLTFANGGPYKVRLKKIHEMSYVPDNYIFEPLTEEDRPFGEHENWQSLGWDSPWWFPLPEGLLYEADPRPLDVEGNPLSDQEIEYVILQMKIEKVDAITIEEIDRNPTRASRPVDDLLDYSKDIRLTPEMKVLVIDATSRHVEKLERYKEMIYDKCGKTS